MDFENLRRREEAEPSAKIKERVDAARNIQNRRFGESSGMNNARMGPNELRFHCQIDDDGAELMKNAFDRLGLTGRSHDRILRMARTIADLEGCEQIGAGHLAEAIQYRSNNVLK